METVWSACLARLEQELPSSQFNTWIMPLNAEINGDTLRLSVSDRFAMQWIKERWFAKIETLCKEYSTLTRVELVLVETASTNKQEHDLPKQKLATPSVKKSTVATSSDPSYLNPNLSFENYVLGNANQMAGAMAIQVAKSLGKVWNPFFIYGGVGLGKTHMLQAIGNAAKNYAPNTKIRYLHAETYVNDVVKTYSGSKTFDQISNQFRQKYHSLDLLLIDDIQFFANKSRTQEEFFYAFNALIEAEKQIVITCDAHPKEVENIEARLKTRFDWGLTVAIQPPELEMRVAILLKKATQSGLSLPQDVAFFIATQVHSSVRELEGALNQVKAMADFHRSPLNIELAKEALKELIAVRGRQTSIENIQQIVSDYYNIKQADMYSKKRLKRIAQPRQIAMAIAREITNRSFPEIGEAFGGKHHTTIMHACNAIADLCKNNQKVAQDFQYLLQVIKN